MSRSFREYLERQYPILTLYQDDTDRRAAELGHEEAWLADQAAQDEYTLWLDKLEEQA